MPNNLIVTFSRIVPDPPRVHLLPITQGVARSEQIELATGSATGFLQAVGGEDVCWVYCAVDCWVAFGESPEADPADVDLSTSGDISTSHFLPADMLRPFGVSVGDKVAVIAA